MSIVTIGLPGGSMDFFLALHYYTIQGQGADSPDAEVLTRLANSFRPLIPGDTTQQEEAQREIADGRFEAFLQEHGREIFDFELAITLGRIGEAGTTDEQLEDAARVLSPLRELASYIGIEGDEELDVVWAALDDARNGNYESLREVMLEIYEKMDTEEGEQEEVTPPTTVRHHWWLSKLWRRGGTV